MSIYVPDRSVLKGLYAVVIRARKGIILQRGRENTVLDDRYDPLIVHSAKAQSGYEVLHGHRRAAQTVSDVSTGRYDDRRDEEVLHIMTRRIRKLRDMSCCSFTHGRWMKW